MADLDTQALRLKLTGPPRDPFGLVGQVVDEQYRVEAVVGEGGFSVVYRGTHLGLSEPIAIKCLKLPGALGSAAVESFVTRFRDEGRILYKLSQGNLHIVRSIASGMTMGPMTGALIPYTVLEWLDGYSLAEELEARRKAGFHGRPLVEMVPLLDSALDAVAYAHIQGVVHRDLNPGNIFFARTREGMRAKILDFGLAKIVSDHALELGPRAETLAHIQIFAPAYAAPEQMDKRLGPVGPQTDVYTIALVLLETMIDRSIISGDHLGEIMAKTLGMHRPTPRALGLHVSDALESLFASALDLDPKKRPDDAGVFWGTLKHTLASEGVSPKVLSTPPPPVKVRSDPPATAQHKMGTGTLITTPQKPTAPSSDSNVPVSRHPWFPKLASTVPMQEGSDLEIARREALRQAEAEQRARVTQPPTTRVATQPARGGMNTELLKRLGLLFLAVLVAGLGIWFVVYGLRGK